MRMKVTKQNKEFLKYALFFFAFVLLYNFLIVNKCSLWGVDSITYTYHLVDYSFGFASKLLPGAFYHLFFKEVNVVPLNIYLTVILIVLFAFVAVVLAKILVSQKEKQTKKLLFIVMLFFLSGPCTFAMFTNELGILDMYSIIICALFLLFCSHKHLKFLVPLCFVALILVNYSSLLSFMVMMSVILLYRITHSEGKEKIILLIIFIVSLLLGIGLAAYFVLYEKSNIVYSFEEFHRQLDLRNLFGQEVNTYYYDFSFFDKFDVKGQNYNEYANITFINAQGNTLLELINTLLTKVYVLITYVYKAYPHYTFSIVFLLLLLAPMFICFIRYWVKKCKAASGREKITYILAIVQLPVILISFFFSNDGVRWLTHSLLIQFTLYFYIAKCENDFDGLNLSFLNRVNQIELFAYGLVYLLTMVEPYP